MEVMEGPMATLPADFDLVDDNFFALHMVDECDDVGGLKKKMSKILSRLQLNTVYKYFLHCFKTF